MAEQRYINIYTQEVLTGAEIKARGSKPDDHPDFAFGWFKYTDPDEHLVDLKRRIANLERIRTAQRSAMIA